MAHNHSRPQGAHRSNDRDSSSRPGSRSKGHRGFRDEQPSKGRWNQSERDSRRDGGAQGGRSGRSSSGRPNWTPPEERNRDHQRGPSFRTRGGSHGGRDHQGDERVHRGERPRGFDRARDEHNGRGRSGAAPDRNRRFEDRPRRDDRDQRSFGDRREQGQRRFDDRAPRRDDRDQRSFGDRREQGQRRFDDRAPRRDDRDQRSFGDRREQGQRRFDDRPRREERRSFDEQPRRDSTYYPSKDSNPFQPKDDVVLERLEAKATSAEDVAGISFADLGIGDSISRALTGMGAVSPFPIQAATIPDVLAGRDVLGRGRTGSGKSIAFGAPIVEMLLRGRSERREIGRAPRALVLAPTRELAQQLNHTIMTLGREVGVFTTVIVGGVKQDRQVEGLRRGVDVVIGTPGRIEDLVEQRKLNLGAVEIAVVDEADHMCELGFLEPVQRILRRTKPGSQKLLFSATLDAEVQTIVKEFLPEPSVHEVAGEEQSTSTIDHQILVTDRYDKDAVLEQIVRNPGRIIVFTRTRAYAERLAEQFGDAGIAAVSLHGDLTQAKRNRSLEKLKRGKVDVLVATDVAARGIHIDDIALVVQADPPDEYKTYMHRSGRTGRAGNDGRVVTVIAPARRKRTQQLLDRAEIEAPMIPVTPGDDLLDTLTAPPAAAEIAEHEPAAAGTDAQAQPTASV
ncbi:Superfamily II DNA and RNA helicase [Agrococcus baldri]|uniref:Superfamily II DNA and RNA helicase n=1 Tax=Agrococcus baldri TaxID=153730 RepID=A0AA94KZ64_9MICO|nr:DEAD/DEAH box helicase [Agrococcus baldri]SFS07979.1 Superfamily II DNA and RNA helicase [Agrococcus baldri]